MARETFGRICKDAGIAPTPKALAAYLERLQRMGKKFANVLELFEINNYPESLRDWLLGAKETSAEIRRLFAIGDGANLPRALEDIASQFKTLQEFETDTKKVLRGNELGCTPETLQKDLRTRDAELAGSKAVANKLEEILRAAMDIPPTTTST